MFYFKKIISYFDYYEYGEKKKNCGYARILVKDHETTVRIEIRDLPVKSSMICELYTLGSEKKKLGQFAMDQGTGCFHACFHSMDLDGGGLSVFAVSGFSIRIDDDKTCETSWEWGLLPDVRLFEKAAAAEPVRKGMTNNADSEKKSAPKEREGGVSLRTSEETFPDETASYEEFQKESSGEDTAPHALREESREVKTEEDTAPHALREESREVKTEEDAAPHALQEELPSVEREEDAAHKKIYADTAETVALSKQTQETEEEKEQNRTEARIKETEKEGEERKPELSAEEIPQQEILHEDKWKQLCTLYPVCHPFGEHEDYISIAPKDFIVLRREYQNLVSNSFLLHSFYNYHHVILGRMGNDDSGSYYIGVPGIYLEREKKVAVMFGFEGFAQSTRKNDTNVTEKSEQLPIETGAFGYYMKQVEI